MFDVCLKIDGRDVLQIIKDLLLNILDIIPPWNKWNENQWENQWENSIKIFFEENCLLKSDTVILGRSIT